MKTHAYELRVRRAWAAATVSRILPPAVQNQLDADVNAFFNTQRLSSRSRPASRESAAKRRRQIEVTPETPTPPRAVHSEVEIRLGCMRSPRGFRTCSFVSSTSLCTGNVRVVCASLSQERMSYRGSVFLSHGIYGKKLSSPIRISAPIMRSAAPKSEMLPLATAYIRDVLFSVYVRIVSHVRRILLLPSPYNGEEIDTQLAADSTTQITSTVIPNGLSQTLVCVQDEVTAIVRVLCEHASVEYIDLSVMMTNSTTNSSVSSFGGDDSRSSMDMY